MFPIVCFFSRDTHDPLFAGNRALANLVLSPHVFQLPVFYCVHLTCTMESQSMPEILIAHCALPIAHCTMYIAHCTCSFLPAPSLLFTTSWTEKNILHGIDVIPLYIYTENIQGICPKLNVILHFCTFPKQHRQNMKLLVDPILKHFIFCTSQSGLGGVIRTELGRDVDQISFFFHIGSDLRFFFRQGLITNQCFAEWFLSLLWSWSLLSRRGTCQKRDQINTNKIWCVFLQFANPPSVHTRVRGLSQLFAVPQSLPANIRF